MKDHESLKVKVAEIPDIENIIAICEENLVANNREKFSADEFAKHGFLMGKMTFDETKKIIEDQRNWLVLVAKNNDETVGYLTGCDIKQMDQNFQNEVFKQISAKKIFYHKQIAKKFGVKKVGEKLLLKMFDEAKKRGYSHVVCKIVHQPFENKISISFHEKFGFKKISEIAEKDYVAGIYLKNF